jgi:ribonuclease H2 subunit A
MTDADCASSSSSPAVAPFPSVKTDASCFTHSYTFHSVDSRDAQRSAKGKEVQVPVIEGEWMLGVDEAGRGPVLGEQGRVLPGGDGLLILGLGVAGPQVYGIAYCRVEYSDELKSLGFAGQSRRASSTRTPSLLMPSSSRVSPFADSKTLKDSEREDLFNVIIDKAEHVKYACRVMSPHDISRGMLRRNPYNLYALLVSLNLSLAGSRRRVTETLSPTMQPSTSSGKSLNTATTSRRSVAFVSSSLQPTHLLRIQQCYVDTVGIAADYQRKLEALFPTVAFVVTSKADAIYPIVSAASIVAKVTRDRFLQAWPSLVKSVEGERQEENVFGSGYPGGESF